MERANIKEKTYICANYRQMNKKTRRNETGKEGEAAARTFLEKRGYEILHTNWHWRHYELDIVAAHEGELVIAEVKTRSDDYLLAPEEAVDCAKMCRIVAAADAYIRLFNLSMPVRFDVMTVIKQDNRYEVDHIEDAFYAPCR